jgi:hypothetical protein
MQVCRALADVAEVYHARYLLQPRALQLFFFPLSGHPPALLATPTHTDMLNVGAAISAGAPHAQLFDRRRAISSAAAASRRWASGEMTNFDYLMLLNTLSGRSHSDLSQYPVFPWVLKACLPLLLLLLFFLLSSLSLLFLPPHPFYAAYLLHAFVLHATIHACPSLSSPQMKPIFFSPSHTANFAQS